MTLGKAFLNDFFKNIPVNLAWIDLNRRFTFVSPSYATLLKKEPDGLVGRSIYAFLPRLEKILEPLFERAASSGEAAEITVEPSNPLQKYWTLKVWPVKEGPRKTAGWILSIINLTAEVEMQTRLEETLAELEEERERIYANMREKERVISLLDQSHYDLAAQHLELEQASAQNSRLITELSHELRTPLNIILGYGQLLQDQKFGAMNPTQRDVARRIVENCRTLSKAIDKRIDLPRGAEEPASPFTAEVALPKLIADVLASIRPLLRQRRIRVRWSGRSALPTLVTDPVRLRRVFLNLIGNLAKFVRNATFTIGLRDLSQEKRVAVTLTESGTRKISPPLSPVLNSYFYLDPRHGNEPGPGLAVVEGLLGQIGGRIELKQGKRSGITFTIYLPYRPPGDQLHLSRAA